MTVSRLHRSACPVLVPGWAYFVRGSDELLFARDHRRLVLRPHNEVATGRSLHAFVRSLDGSHDLNEVVAMACDELGWLEEDVLRLVDRLCDLGVIIDAAAAVPEGLTADDLLSFDRQLSFFAEFERDGLTRFDYQLRLKRSRIAVLGLGGGGSWLVAALMGTGIGSIVGIDGDAVEQSNLDRQLLYSPADFDMPKAEAAQARLRELRPGLDFWPVQRYVTSEADLEPLLDGVDLLIGLADYPPRRLRHIVTLACLRTGTPHIHQLGPWVGPLCVPGETACYGCYERVATTYDSTYLQVAVQANDNSPWPRRSKPGHNAFIAGVMAWEVVSHLSGCRRPATYDGFISTSLERSTMAQVPLARQNDCEFCGRNGVAWMSS